MYQNQHIKQAHCTCAGTHTRACIPHPRTHTHLIHAKKHSITFSQRVNGPVFPRMMGGVVFLFFFKPVTLIPSSLLKHVFTDAWSASRAALTSTSSADKEWKTNFADSLNADEL